VEPTVNPFGLQELADALQGTEKIVLVKPSKPDLSLWLGGVERLYNAGIKKLGKFIEVLYSMKKTKHNIPWQLLLNYKTDSLICHYL
jgi:chorismate mutase